MLPEFSQLNYYTPQPPRQTPRHIETDVCVYGGHSGGVAAAVQVARLGLSAVVAEFGRHLGGMTASGLGATDIGNKAAIGGIAREFYRRLGTHYGKAETWTFEPGVAEGLFRQMAAEAGVEVHFEQRLRTVHRDGNLVRAIEMEDGTVYRAKIFIDASYEGDLMAAAGVSFHVGRESNAIYGETFNGIHFGHRNHNFDRSVDPFMVSGNPQSGVLPGVCEEPLGTQGDGDHRVQAYNFRVCMSDNPQNQRPFPKPENYDPRRYELGLRYLLTGVWDVFRLNVPMPNGKSDHNNFGGFASDNIGRNYAWPNGDYTTRELLFQDHVTYQMGLFYFLANDRRVPQNVRDEVNRWGLPLDEFSETANWPHQLYVREARRMVSDYVMTEHDCTGAKVADDCIGLAAYQIDSHNCRRIVVDGVARNEGNVEYPVKCPFPISYRSLVPREAEAANLLVPFCLSASHAAFGSIRMEPVFMVLGQSAATAAAIAIADNSTVQKVNYEALREQLIKDGQVLVHKPLMAEARSKVSVG